MGLSTSAQKWTEKYQSESLRIQEKGVDLQYAPRTTTITNDEGTTTTTTGPASNNYRYGTTNTSGNNTSLLQKYVDQRSGEMPGYRYEYTDILDPRVNGTVGMREPVNNTTQPYQNFKELSQHDYNLLSDNDKYLYDKAKATVQQYKTNNPYAMSPL
jgi:hypothetical protein